MSALHVKLWRVLTGYYLSSAHDMISRVSLTMRACNHSHLHEWMDDFMRHCRICHYSVAIFASLQDRVYEINVHVLLK